MGLGFRVINPNWSSKRARVASRSTLQDRRIKVKSPDDLGEHKVHFSSLEVLRVRVIIILLPLRFPCELACWHAALTASKCS